MTLNWLQAGHLASNTSTFFSGREFSGYKIFTLLPQLLHMAAIDIAMWIFWKNCSLTLRFLNVAKEIPISHEGLFYMRLESYPNGTYIKLLALQKLNIRILGKYFWSDHPLESPSTILILLQAHDTCHLESYDFTTCVSTKELSCEPAQVWEMPH